MKNIKISKQTIFWIIVGVAVVFVLCAIIFTIIGTPEFIDQIKQIKNEKLSILSTPMFTYGIFCWIMSLLTLIVVGLYGNSIFNKKYKNQ